MVFSTLPARAARFWLAGAVLPRALGAQEPAAARAPRAAVDAPKGMVQIARYFGTEFLRPELEKARDRIVNLVSLYLESTSGDGVAA